MTRRIQSAAQPIFRPIPGWRNKLVGIEYLLNTFSSNLLTQNLVPFSLSLSSSSLITLAKSVCFYTLVCSLSSRDLSCHMFSMLIFSSSITFYVNYSLKRSYRKFVRNARITCYVFWFDLVMWIEDKVRNYIIPTIFTYIPFLRRNPGVSAEIEILAVCCVTSFLSFFLLQNFFPRNFHLWHY